MIFKQTSFVIQSDLFLRKYCQGFLLKNPSNNKGVQRANFGLIQMKKGIIKVTMKNEYKILVLSFGLFNQENTAQSYRTEQYTPIAVWCHIAKACGEILNLTSLHKKFQHENRMSELTRIKLSCIVFLFTATDKYLNRCT